MHTTTRHSRRYYHNLWQRSQQERQELIEKKRELEFKVKARDHSIGKLQGKVRTLTTERDRALRTAEALRERVRDDPVSPYKSVIERCLTLLRRTHPGCDCSRWRQEGRHATTCSILKRAEIDVACQELGIKHWRTQEG